jgi:hypothetical protein
MIPISLQVDLGSASLGYSTALWVWFSTTHFSSSLDKQACWGLFGPGDGRKIKEPVETVRKDALLT